MVRFMSETRKGRDEYYLLLNELKSEPFDVTHILSIGDDESLIRMISTWPSVQRTIVSAPFDNELVHGAWLYVDFNAGDWARLAGLTIDRIWRNWISLAKQRFIYPDGTYPNAIKKMLISRAEEITGEESCDGTPIPVVDA